MRIVLAPMEGVVDHSMRARLTGLGGFDRCVTEFIRVTDQLLPRRVFYRFCPELHHGSRTPAGVPVYLQLLGGKPEFMALNARRAAALGAAGIDINFGCPAKLVNRNDGGAILLREPDRICRIVEAVRQAVPATTPVTAKVRLGFEDQAQFDEIADAAASGGADELTVHARTRRDGYRPPAYWDRVAAARARHSLPIFINGDIWSPADCRRARAESGCSDVMIGRGALARPDLAAQLKADLAGKSQAPLAWSRIAELLLEQLATSVATLPLRHALNPVKQWLSYLERGYPEAVALFQRVKRLTDPVAMRATLLAEAGLDPARHSNHWPLPVAVAS
ncbi:MAG: tRNA-dihydrouridine synthase [Spongiibacteraceae bacterium]|jgi:tRNA-dihydrouridine synthase C|nr:tRNA-dihydrouridine synthase [Spongiibacteraceae bacterium]